MLLEQGYTVQAAKDGKEAVEMFSEFNPDLAILDMRMPKMSGGDVCAAIRMMSDVPIIMFTSTNDTAAVKDAIQKGATDFVLKSTGMAALTDRVAFHLANGQGKPAATPEAAAPSSTPVTGKAPFVADVGIVGKLWRNKLGRQCRRWAGPWLISDAPNDSYRPGSGRSRDRLLNGRKHDTFYKVT